MAKYIAKYRIALKSDISCLIFSEVVKKKCACSKKRCGPALELDLIH